MATESVSGNPDWVIKESRTHKGTFYRYNAANGKSEWLTPDGVSTMPLAPLPADASKAAARGHNHNHNHSHGGHNHSFPLNATNLSYGISPTKGSGRRPMTRSSRATNVSWGTDDTSEGSECVCTVCECGKHMCPLHGLAKPHPFAGNSRYREDYPRHPLRPNGRDKTRHMVHLTPADPDQFKSKYEEDFKPFVPEPPKSMKPHAAAPQHVPFDGTTTNREMFHAKPIDKVPLRRPPSPLRVTGPFEGTTTTREAHCGFPGAKPRESMAPNHNALASVPFEGTTQYKKDYTPHELEARRKRDLGFAGYDYGPPRDLHTEHRDAFTPKPIHYCPVLDLEPKQPSMHTGHIHYTKKERPTFKYFPGRPKTADVHSTL